MARGNSIGKASVVVSANADQLASGLKAAQTKINSFGDHVGKSLQEKLGFGGGLGTLLSPQGGIALLAIAAGREFAKAAFDVRGFREEIERTDKFAAKLANTLAMERGNRLTELTNLRPEDRAEATRDDLAKAKMRIDTELKLVQEAQRELDRWTGKGDGGQRRKDLPEAVKKWFLGTLGEFQQDKRSKLQQAQDAYAKSLDHERELKAKLAEFEAYRGKLVADAFGKIDSATRDVMRQADQLGMTPAERMLDNFRRELADIGVSGKDASQKLAELDGRLKQLDAKQFLSDTKGDLSRLTGDLEERLGRSHLSAEEKLLQKIERSGLGLDTGNVRGLLAMQADLERMGREVAKPAKVEPVKFAAAVDANSAEAAEIEARHRFRPDATHNPNAPLEKKMDTVNRTLEAIKREMGNLRQFLGVL